MDLPTCISVHNVHAVPVSVEARGGGLHPLELELQMDLNHHVDVRNYTQIIGRVASALNH